MSKYESADLIMKLYELRRDPTMREARSWMLGFFPTSPQDIMQAMVNPHTSNHFRMAITYWDMACSFVNHGAIDAEMFADANTEFIPFFAKIEPFLSELRQMTNNPTFLHHLETFVMKQPDAKERLALSRETMKRWMKAREELTATAE